MSHWRNDSMHYNNSNDLLRTNPWPLHRSRQPQQHQLNSQPYPSFLPQSETSPSPYRLQSSEGNWRSPKGSLPSNALLFTSVMPKNIGVPYHQQYSTGSSSDTPNITATTTTTSSSRSTQSLQLTRQPSAQEDKFGLNIDQIEFEVAHLWNLAVDVARKLNSGC
ncbi:hypothetical protein BDQ17DRAFT_1362648 [Cyathus striatus]|nr:hypothetical protein BDQ17DRAFT_1362648 [Cyathus striatus]